MTDLIPIREYLVVSDCLSVGALVVKQAMFIVVVLIFFSNRGLTPFPLPR